MNLRRFFVPSGFENRLLAAYVGAFSIVIAVFAAAVWFSFAAVLRNDSVARLNTLARAGTAAVFFSNRGFTVNEIAFGGFSVHLDSEGLEWFDLRGLRIARRGRTLEPAPPPRKGFARFLDGARTLDTDTVLLYDRSGTQRGFVRASALYDAGTDPAYALNRGLIGGAVLALIAGALGGALLARSAVLHTEAGYERLRQFTADASHELRGPLAALAGTTSVALREAPELGEPTRPRLLDIEALTQHMRGLVDDLLILARADRSMERELFAVDFDRLMENIRERYGHRATERGVTFALAGQAGLEIYGSPDQLERVVANIVENAVRHASAGGRVDVTWTADAIRLQIGVSDDGAGISSENLERVFDRFWRADNARRADGGSGLGLSIARALARRHGGDVTVESELGAGSTFTVTLPRRPPAL